jgi:hypothetical protein
MTLMEHSLRQAPPLKQLPTSKYAVRPKAPVVHGSPFDWDVPDRTVDRSAPHLLASIAQRNAERMQPLEGSAKPPPIRQPHLTTMVGDIDGAAAASTRQYTISKRFVNRPDLYTPKDIHGAQPARLTSEVAGGLIAAPAGGSAPAAGSSLSRGTLGGSGSGAGGDRSLRTRDIDHCYPESKVFATPRSVNPLDPQYAMPKRTMVPAAFAPMPTVDTTSKQALAAGSPRDPLRLDDIVGTRPVRRFSERGASQHRSPLDTADIALSTAGSLTAQRKRKTVSRALETRDITHPPELDVGPFTSKPRGTNPLEPNYKVFCPKGVDPTTWSVGAVDGSHPKPPKPQRADRPMFSLRTDDIDGCKSKPMVKQAPAYAVMYAQAQQQASVS